MATDDPSESPASNRAHGAVPRSDSHSVQGDARAGRHAQPRIPRAIADRYLRVNNRYFFPDRTLAFIDDGGRLRVRTENHEVLHTAVAIAEARGWSAIELKGTRAFRQGMWHEASLRGIEVRGYEPSQVETLQMQRSLLSRQLPQEMPRKASQASRDREASIAREGVVPPETDHRPGQPWSDPAKDRPSAERERRPPVRGTLMAAAAAPYLFDPAQRMSFYVTLRTETGDRTVWGTDLERAVAESASRPRVGDEVVLTRHGTRPVNVRVAARNAHGELVGETRVPAQRAHWSVETSGHHRAMEHGASRFRVGALVFDANGVADPELTTAAANLRLAAQYAQRLTGDQASQHQLLQQIREQMADALAQGRPMHLPHRRWQPAPTRARDRKARADEDRDHERV